MRLDQVSQANYLRWDGACAPFYEIYYLKLTQPAQDWSLWVRYTLVAPKLGAPTAYLWGIFHKEGEAPFALKQAFPISEHDIFHQDTFIKLGENFLSLEGAKGELFDSFKPLKWDLRFEDPTDSIALYPYEFLYEGGFPKTKYMEPRVKTYVSGEIQWGKQHFFVDRLSAHQAHIWGTQYAKCWSWANCTQFQEDEEAFFEALEGRISVGPFTSPKMTLIFLHWRGRDYAFNGLCRWLLNSSDSSLLEWNLEANDSQFKIKGQITRDQPQIVGVTYEGPHGEKRYCHNTNRASLKLTLFQKEQKEWKEITTLTSHKTTAFETVGERADPRISFLL